MGTTHRRSRMRTGAAALLAVGLLATACSDDPEPPARTVETEPPPRPDMPLPDGLDAEELTYYDVAASLEELNALQREMGLEPEPVDVEASLGFYTAELPTGTDAEGYCATLRQDGFEPFDDWPDPLAAAGDEATCVLADTDVIVTTAASELGSGTLNIYDRDRVSEYGRLCERQPERCEG